MTAVRLKRGEAAGVLALLASRRFGPLFWDELPAHPPRPRAAADRHPLCRIGNAACARRSNLGRNPREELLLHR